MQRRFLPVPRMCGAPDLEVSAGLYELSDPVGKRPPSTSMTTVKGAQAVWKSEEAVDTRRAGPTVCERDKARRLETVRSMQRISGTQTVSLARSLGPGSVTLHERSLIPDPARIGSLDRTLIRQPPARCG